MCKPALDMKLNDLFKDKEVKKLLSASMIRIIEAGRNIEIKGITDDSRKVKPGYIFIAVKGLEHNGHSFIEQAVENGTACVVFDINSNYQLPAIKSEKTIFIGLNNSRRALGLLWASWYGFPSRKLKVIGVTGTDGKTTTTNLIYHVLKIAGEKVGMVSTINARIGEREIDTGFHVTNPEPELLQKLLREMVGEGIRYAILEVTSHGLDQERTSGVDFYGAVITNVTHEHLDYHKTYKAYLETKGKLFRKVKFSILNKDDSSYSYLKTIVSGKIITYGFDQEATLYAGSVRLLGDSSLFKIVSGAKWSNPNTSILRSVEVKEEVRLCLPGMYNIANALAAAAVSLELGLSFKQVRKGLESFTHLEGRFDEINLGQPFRVIIDFAHTPNALAQVLELSLKIKNQSFDRLRIDPERSRTGQNAKLIVVFGCAGERDREKRSMMGEIAGKLAELTILTAEDPRLENVNDIIDQIANGCKKAGASEGQRAKGKGQSYSREERNFIRVPDRKEAIEFAISNAKSGDLILITGKGHEKSMCFGMTEYPWNDKQVAISILNKKFSLK